MQLQRIGLASPHLDAHIPLRVAPLPTWQVGWLSLRIKWNRFYADLRSLRMGPLLPWRPRRSVPRKLRLLLMTVLIALTLQLACARMSLLSLSVVGLVLGTVLSLSKLSLILQMLSSPSLRSMPTSRSWLRVLTPSCLSVLAKLSLVYQGVSRAQLRSLQTSRSSWRLLTQALMRVATTASRIITAMATTWFGKRCWATVTS
mmetsp:Transcript_32704/g.82733  ORF Transcript_32704/g.82733 Transcript_32704/m.82733 type:complete len:202 (-) Transcript_32704:84-689(-)